MTDKELAEMWQKRAEMISITCDSMSSKYHAAMAAGHAAQATIAFLKAKYSIPDSDVESQPFATWYDRYLQEKASKNEAIVALEACANVVLLRVIDGERHGAYLRALEVIKKATGE